MAASGGCTTDRGGRTKIGFGLGGVICVSSEVESAAECREAERTDLGVPSERHDVYLVSSRPERMRKETENWLAEHGVEYEKLILRRTRSFGELPPREVIARQANFKAEIIDKFGLVAFVEGRPRVRRLLDSACPRCMVLSSEHAKALNE